MPASPSEFDQAHATVLALVADFAAHESRYLAPDYQEAELRKDFLDKFFIALGWDVNHDTQKNPYEQEVKVERGQQQGAARKRADYAFALAPNFRDVRFFVEAKKPSVDLANADDYFQTLRYGWNSGNSLAMLTDFESFHILDCRYKPSVETALSRLVKDGAFSYRDLADPEKFARLYWLFSREAIAAGSLEKFASTLPRSRGGARQLQLLPGGSQKIDESFLEELDEHRLTLARAFKRADPVLDGDTLTEIVQRTLDRLVFIRFLEDRLIEGDYLVAKFGQRGSAWGDFTAACRRLDGIYNGIVFKKHPLLDAPDFTPDDRAFTEVCKRLSHLNSPFDFNAIPIHILGSIYERFLGKIIVATPKQARVEEKPEVRKAGGVYYTPEYIVRYIVANTVGKLIEGKNPEAVAKLRFADIACGSGSFLLGIYETLLEYHTAYYNKFPKQAAKGDCFTREDGSLHLTLKKRREILLNNLYGVDIDAQAVEVAQLSLYLRLLQEETTASAREHQREFHETLLPPLGSNIKCGNSLIGTDILEGQLFEPTEERKLNPMDFAAAFPKIMREGGFDAVVGNPPYVRIQTVQENTPASPPYYKASYHAAAKGNYDVYVLFVERALGLLNPVGIVGYIVPHKFFNSEYGTPLRTLLSEGRHLQHIVHFGAQQIFQTATTYTCLLFLTKARSRRCRYESVTSLATWSEDPRKGSERGELDAARINGIAWNIHVGPGSLLADKLSAMLPKLGEVAEIFVGLQTSADDVFILNLVRETPATLVLRSKALGTEVEMEKTLLHPLVSGADVRAYAPLGRRQFILFPYAVNNEAATLLPFPELARDYPMTASYLERNHARLAERERGKFRDKRWHRFGRSQNLGIQSRRKLCVPRLVNPLCAAYDSSGSHFLDNVDVGGLTWKVPHRAQGFEYLLGLLNSRLAAWYFPKVSAPFRGGWMSANRQFLSRLPFRAADFDDPLDRARHGKMVRLVEQMLAAKQQLASARTDKDRNYFTGKCNTLDRQIDALVYELYGLTEEEIALVESSGEKEIS